MFILIKILLETNQGFALYWSVKAVLNVKLDLENLSHCDSQLIIIILYTYVKISVGSVKFIPAPSSPYNQVTTR
jgi:hypothetical protein